MPLLPFPTRSTVALVAVGDPGRDRTVYATIVLLVALGFTMIMLAVWLVRNTRPDPEVLAPLERMGQRRWRRADPVWQRRHLDEVRPGGADPLEPTSAPPATDDDFERGPQPIGFDDLVASSAPASAAAAGLSVPSAEAQDVEGTLDIDHSDEQMAGGGDAMGSAPKDAAADDAASAGGDAGLIEVGEIDDAASDHNAPDATADVGPGDDDDITGEQDTDDFLAVLDEVYELDSDVDPDADLVVDPGADPDAVVDPDADLVVDAVADPDAVVDPDADPVVDAVADPDAAVDPDADPVVVAVADPDAVVEPDADLVVDAVADPDAVVEPDADPVVDAVADPDAVVEPDADPAAEAGLEPEVRSAVEPELGVDRADDHDVGSDVEPDVDDDDAHAPG